MKSLEIVNDIAKHLKDYLDDLKMTKEDFKLRKFIGVEHIFERLEEKISEVQTSMDNAQQIKQDLEVLEIIKNKNIQIRELKHTLKGLDKGIYITMDEVLFAYNLYHRLKDELPLTMEELLKLKQWLEVNK